MNTISNHEELETENLISFEEFAERYIQNENCEKEDEDGDSNHEELETENFNSWEEFVKRYLQNENYDVEN